MADIDAARAEIQWVVSRLVGRFGSEEEVFEHLTLALCHLRETPPTRTIEEAVAVTEPEAAELTATAEAEPSVEAEPEEVEFIEPAIVEEVASPKKPTHRRQRR